MTSTRQSVLGPLDRRGAVRAQAFTGRGPALGSVALSVIAAMFAGILGGSAAEPESDARAASGPGQVIECTYTESPTRHVLISYLIAKPLSESLKKQPDFGQHDVARLVLGLKDAPPMAMAWDKTANILYLDLNRNLDLTDDPAGVISNASGSKGSPTFTGVRLGVPAQGTEMPFLLDVTMFPMPVWTHLNIQLRSFWQGKAAFDGHAFQVGVVQIPSSEDTAEDTPRLILRPWERREESLDIDGELLDAVPMPRELFFRGRTYRVECKLDPTRKPASFRLVLQDTNAAMGEVQLTGQYLDRVVLVGGKRTVVLDQPAALERVPQGRYTVQSVRLRSGQTTATLAPSRGQGEPSINVTATEPAVLAFGGPLTNSVSIARRGKSLSFNYELRGGAGAHYSLTAQGARVQPEFAVYQGDRKVASGKFEFG